MTKDELSARMASLGIVTHSHLERLCTGMTHAEIATMLGALLGIYTAVAEQHFGREYMLVALESAAAWHRKNPPSAPASK